jgi:hypothetical protein
VASDRRPPKSAPAELCSPPSLSVPSACPSAKRSRMRQRCVYRTPTTQGLGLRSTSHPVEPQRRDSVDVAEFLGCCHAIRSAATAATPRDATLSAGPERSGTAGVGGTIRDTAPIGLGPARLARSNPKHSMRQKGVSRRPSAAVPIFSPWGSGLFNTRKMYNFPGRTLEIVGGPAQNRFHLPREERPRFSITARLESPAARRTDPPVPWGKQGRHPLISGTPQALCVHG